MLSAQNTKTTGSRLSLAFLLAAVACSGGQGAEDLGNIGGGKTDFQGIYDLPLYVEAKSEANLTFRGSGGFKVTVTQPESTAVMRLRLTEGDDVLFENHESATEQSFEFDPGDNAEHAYILRVTNRSYSKDLHGLLTIEPGEGGGPPPDPTGLQYNSYKVLFTNPLCGRYDYSSPIATADGEGERTGKPENVYCKYDDGDASGARPSSPQYQLTEWVDELNAGDELFLAYLSYSNRTVGSALCDAAERGVDVTFVLNGHTSRSEELEACGGTVLIRGNEGGIGYAHNKIFMVNPNGDSPFMKLAFSSGNMSSGAVLHHENWHFIEVKRDSYFAATHLCLMNAQIDEDSSSSKAAYGEALDNCRDAIPYQPETNMRAFFIPKDGWSATEALMGGIDTAQTISIGAHRFSYPAMIDALADRLASDTSVSIRLVADDDLYWLNPWGGGAGSQPGNNMGFEADNVEELWQAGDEDRFQVKYMETNHGSHLLHHNKFLIFEGMADKPDGVLCGAANLTGTGFWENFENIYYIEIPEVVAAFKTQYGRFWDGEKGSSSEPEPPRATFPWDMPAEDVAP